MSYIAHLDERYSGVFSKLSSGQRKRLGKSFLKGACHSCNMFLTGLACNEAFRDMGESILRDCWHPVGTFLVRSEVMEWADRQRGGE